MLTNMNILNLNSEIESLFDSKEEKKKEMLPIQKGQKKNIFNICSH
jgi:hypothetical protein